MWESHGLPTSKKRTFYAINSILANFQQRYPQAGALEYPELWVLHKTNILCNTHVYIIQHS